MATTQVLINGFEVVNSDEIQTIQEIDSSTVVAKLEPKNVDVQEEIVDLLNCAGLEESQVAATVTGAGALRLLGAHIWLREYFATIATDLDPDEGFSSKAAHHQKMVIRQQRLKLGLDEKCNPVGPISIDLVAGEEADRDADSLRFIPVS